MGRRKDGKPRVFSSVVNPLDLQVSRPYFYTSLDCRDDAHEECPGCPGCTCHLNKKGS